MAGYIIHYSTTSEVDRQKVASFIMTNYKTYCRLTDASTWIIGTSDDTENAVVIRSKIKDVCKEKGHVYVLAWAAERDNAWFCDQDICKWFDNVLGIKRVDEAIEESRKQREESEKRLNEYLEEKDKVIAELEERVKKRGRKPKTKAE